MFYNNSKPYKYLKTIIIITTFDDGKKKHNKWEQ